ncbi:NUDIX domain-containing protein [Embleya sp. NBC_00896]|uniref:NUDIX domain-containing protein n=1 Tax=Embleya sp. NBC_00896 TaxID=2975961 RepID=UPI00386693CE|nr:NUDIX domain-containing protein [Embleya sp. NBC_00896]
MAVPPDDVRAALRGYLAGRPDEAPALAGLRALLADGVDVVYGRGHAHVVAAVAAHTDDGRVLHVRDHGSDSWILPCGHPRAGDHSLRGVALRALAEQSAIAPELVEPLPTAFASDVSFHIPADVTIDGDHVVFHYPYRPTAASRYANVRALTSLGNPNAATGHAWLTSGALLMR